MVCFDTNNPMMIQKVNNICIYAPEVWNELTNWGQVMHICISEWCHHHHWMKWHDEIIKWKHFPCYWRFVQGIHWSLVNSPHKGQWHRALIFSLIFAWINGWVNNCEAGDLRCQCAHYDITVMMFRVKPLPKPVMNYCQLDPDEQTWVSK